MPPGANSPEQSSRTPGTVWLGRQGSSWSGQQNLMPHGAADLARSCESDCFFLTSREPHMPCWPPFKEQLIIPNARPAGALCPHPTLRGGPQGRWLGAGGHFSESWKLLTCVSAELARRGLHAGCLAASEGHSGITALGHQTCRAKGVPGERQVAQPPRCRLLTLHPCLPESRAAQAAGFLEAVSMMQASQGWAQEKGAEAGFSPSGPPRVAACHPVAARGLQLIEGLGRGPGTAANLQFRGDKRSLRGSESKTQRREARGKERSLPDAFSSVSCGGSG